MTWKLLLNGWHTAYEPRALVGMQVPASLRALWMQRKRWARGQGEVLHVHFSEVWRWRNHRMWLLSIGSLASLVWVVALLASFVFTVFAILVDEDENIVGFALAWGVAICFMATIQMIVALTLERGYDRSIIRALVVGALYPVAFWLVSAIGRPALRGHRPRARSARQPGRVEHPARVTGGLHPPSTRHSSSRSTKECPRQESNLCTRFRKPLLYPLSYGGGWLNQAVSRPGAPSTVSRLELEAAPGGAARHEPPPCPIRRPHLRPRRRAPRGDVRPRRVLRRDVRGDREAAAALSGARRGARPAQLRGVRGATARGRALVREPGDRLHGLRPGGGDRADLPVRPDPAGDSRPRSGTGSSAA